MIRPWVNREESDLWSEVNGPCHIARKIVLRLYTNLHWGKWAHEKHQTVVKEMTDFNQNFWIESFDQTRYKTKI